MKFWMYSCFLNARNCHADNIELNFKVMRKCALELSFGICMFECEKRDQFADLEKFFFF